MTEHEDLIARLRNQSGVQTAGVNERVALMDEAADVLEKVTAERDNWRLSAEEAERAEQRAEKRAKEAERSYLSLEWERIAKAEMKRRKEAEAERDALAAVVEQVRATLEHYQGQKVDVAPIDILDMLPAPSVALDHVRAEAWDEGYFRRMDDYPFDPEERDNPYRKEQP